MGRYRQHVRVHQQRLRAARGRRRAAQTSSSAQRQAGTMHFTRYGDQRSVEFWAYTQITRGSMAEASQQITLRVAGTRLHVYFATLYEINKKYILPKHYITVNCPVITVHVIQPGSQQTMES